MMRRLACAMAALALAGGVETVLAAYDEDAFVQKSIPAFSMIEVLFRSLAPYSAKESRSFFAFCVKPMVCHAS